jgi:Na+-transporting NADH:ubiquinone oxidoreductase subunit NqrC
MGTIEIFSLVASIASIILAVVAILLSLSSEQRSQQNHFKTVELLAQVDKRAEITEKTVGEHFEKLMGTVLDIVNTATTDKEVRAAEIKAKSEENSGKIQMKLMDNLTQVVQSGEKDKVEAFIKIFQAMTAAGSLGHKP